MQKVINSILCMLIVISVQAQRCSANQHQQKLNKSFTYKAHRTLLNAQAFFRSQNIRDEEGNCKEIIKIPVAVHYYGVQPLFETCAIKAAQNQIKTLNEDFQGLNADLLKWENLKAGFPEIKIKNACIEFELAARNHPNGWGLTEGKPAVVFNSLPFRDIQRAFDGYLNIFVGVIDDGALGYSPLGGFGDGDGVAIAIEAFSSQVCGNIGGFTPYDQGRTATHELGHYLNLEHIWGRNCSEDDGISDTPNSQRPYTECPILGSTCGSQDLLNNYMDYVDDRCMFMFTAGQVDKMEQWLLTRLVNIVDNGENVLSVDTFTNDSIFVDTALVDSTLVDTLGSTEPIDTITQDTSDINTPQDTIVTDTTITTEMPDSTDTGQGNATNETELSEQDRKIAVFISLVILGVSGVLWVVRQIRK